MSKFCTNCGKELDNNSAMCLNCGKILEEDVTSGNLNNGSNSKKRGLPTWAIVLIVVGCVVLIPIIILIIIGVFSYNIISDVNNNNDFNFSMEEELIGTIDDTLIGDDLRITLTDALMFSSVPGSYVSDVPSDGKEYLVFFFEIENLDDEKVYISSYDFDGYVDGYTISKKYLYNDINGIEELGSNLAPGMKVNGYVAFEVDTTWKNFEIHYEEFDFDDEDDKFIFKVKNSDDITGA